MSTSRVHGEYVVWRRLTALPDLARLRNSLCGLLFDAPSQIVVSVVLFLDETCLGAFEGGLFPVEVCVVRGTDPHYLRIDVSGSRLAPPSRPGFMDLERSAAGWGVVHDSEGMKVWAYLTLPLPAPSREAPPWSRLDVCLPANPTWN
ncbi:hypothetical protein HFP15_11910 [Amycolatopsis sp. K13G38]|uniref:ATP-binding protein n=1 Tax=Amycolatopsis acididurans TaxID=2724524 RepID=A0ABX1J1C7_9PSEU|nr:hypothetical protein [Amycolatopsis acididurans]NKQ53583.1 hypothetical protein [Amycolatopsis acididurans]